MNEAEVLPEPKTEAELQLAQQIERLRQQKEIFVQRKLKDMRWFTLRLVAGFASVALLAAVMVVASVILLGVGYSETAVNFAGTALCVDVVGVLAGAWKIVLSPDYKSDLEPTVAAPEQNEQAGS